MYVSSFNFYLSRDWCTNKGSTKRQPLITEGKGEDENVFLISIFFKFKVFYIYVQLNNESVLQCFLHTDLDFTTLSSR